MMTVNPCPICGKSMPLDITGYVCDHNWPESVATTNNDEYMIWDGSEFTPLDEKMQINLR
jgi:hypothetical protein